MRLLKSLLLLGILVILGTGCATHEPYHGPIGQYFVKGIAQHPSKPLPVQVLVRSTTTEDPQTRGDLVNVFMINLKQTGKFADVVPSGAPINPALRRLEADVNLQMEVSNWTSPFYVASWGCIFPMFIPLNKITADGQMTAVIRDNETMLKTYSSKKTTISHRNSVGLAWIRIETRTMERWSRPALTALFDDLIAQILADSETYQKYEKPAPGP